MMRGIFGYAIFAKIFGQSKLSSSVYERSCMGRGMGITRLMVQVCSEVLLCNVGGGDKDGAMGWI